MNYFKISIIALQQQQSQQYNNSTNCHHYEAKNDFEQVTII